MALYQFVEGEITCITPLDASLCTNLILTLYQHSDPPVKIDLREWRASDRFGNIIFKVPAEKTKRLKPGYVKVQLRGFVDGVEFISDGLDKIEVKKTIHREILTDG